MPFTSPKYASNRSFTGTPSLPSIGDSKSTAPRLGNTYNLAAERTKVAAHTSSKPLRSAGRGSSKLPNHEGVITRPHAEQVTLSKEQRLARHFPSSLPAAPAPITRRVSNLIVLPPDLLRGWALPARKQEPSVDKVIDSERGELELGEKWGLPGASTLGLRGNEPSETHHGR